MTRPTFLHLLELGIACAIGLAFAGGWLASEIYRTAHPPAFAIAENYQDEIPLIRLEKINGKILEGSYTGKQPRFLLGENKELVVPSDQKFQLDLGKL
jgi:hypothetical protein